MLQMIRGALDFSAPIAYYPVEETAVSFREEDEGHYGDGWTTGRLCYR